MRPHAKNPQLRKMPSCCSTKIYPWEPRTPGGVALTNTLNNALLMTQNPFTMLTMGIDTALRRSLVGSNCVLALVPICVAQRRSLYLSNPQNICSLPKNLTWAIRGIAASVATSILTAVPYISRTAQYAEIA
jgi:hypothetical protein